MVVALEWLLDSGVRDGEIAESEQRLISRVDEREARIQVIQDWIKECEEGRIRVGGDKRHFPEGWGLINFWTFKYSDSIPFFHPEVNLGDGTEEML
jgi:hypothetical protein